MDIFSSLTLLASLWMGWSMGANDAANSHGTAVGSGMRTLKEAIFISSFFAILGATLEGSHVIKTIGKGIVPLNELDKEVALQIAFSAMIGAAAFTTVATYLKLPVSMTHSSIGAVAGAGLALAEVPVKWSKLLDIFIAWIATPIGAAIIAYLLYKVFLKLFPFILKEPNQSEKVIKWLLTLSACYMAYAWGANDVANATGVVVGAKMMDAVSAAFLGSLAMSIGIATWGWRVIETVGTRITHMLPLMAFTSEVACALNVHLYSRLGIPVSTTHSIVGAVYGVGLVHGRHSFDLRIARDIFFAWSLTPAISGLMAFAVMKGILVLL